MSQENVEIVRSLYEIGAGDWFNVAPDQFDRAFRESIDEQFEARCRRTIPRANRCFVDARGSMR